MTEEKRATMVIRMTEMSLIATNLLFFFGIPAREIAPQLAVVVVPTLKCAPSLSQPGMKLACACFASFCLFHWQASSSPLCRLNFKKGNAKLIKLESFPLPLHKRRFYKSAQLFSRYLLLTKPHSTALMLVFHT